jgi:hypothetical protein
VEQRAAILLLCGNPNLYFSSRGSSINQFSRVEHFLQTVGESRHSMSLQQLQRRSTSSFIPLIPRKSVLITKRVLLIRRASSHQRSIRGDKKAPFCDKFCRVSTRAILEENIGIEQWIDEQKQNNEEQVTRPCIIKTGH